MELPHTTMKVLLDDAIVRDRTTARRTALVEILLQERFLTREQLIVRVEGKLGVRCFGETAWEDTFYRDMVVTKRALKENGYFVAYSRNLHHPGYYLRDQGRISATLASLLAGSVTEVDPKQLAILKQHSFRQRFQMGCSISNVACQVVTNRIRQRNPEFTTAESQQLALQRKR